MTDPMSASQPERTWTLHNYYWLGSRYVMCECINGGEATCSKDGHVPVVEQAALDEALARLKVLEDAEEPGVIRALLEAVDECAVWHKKLAAETARANAEWDKGYEQAMQECGWQKNANGYWKPPTP